MSDRDDIRDKTEKELERAADHLSKVPIEDLPQDDQWRAELAAALVRRVMKGKPVRASDIHEIADGVASNDA